jgi:hypothetical protein
MGVYDAGSPAFRITKRKSKEQDGGTYLDNNSGDGLIGAEICVGAAGVLLGELAHNLHRLAAGVGRCSRCSPPPDSIQPISIFFSFFSQRTRKYLELGRRICGRARWAPPSTTGGRGAPRSRRWWRRRWVASPAGAAPARRSRWW